MDSAGAARARLRAGSVSAAKVESLEDYVSQLEGKRAIRKVLIANNGIAAVKCIRFVRKWAYEALGNERAITFAVMTTPEDLKANAEYIRMADEVIDVPGGSNNNNFANVKLVVQVAESCKADAVWAGWGHASENPALPRSLARKGITFIGPAAGPMHALGDKIGSTIIAQSAKVPTIPWNGAGITASYKEDGCVRAEALDAANIKTEEEAVEAARRVGFPLMVKASEGGGGKGIRMVTEESQLADAYRQVRSEVSGSPVFVMQLASAARHLEVQLLADEYGTAIALSGRDCSIQRRHQKIIEEGPVLAPPPEVWDDMMRAAVNLAVEVGYANAGTVEYLYMPEEKRFAFLELNPRLQVEHPVTEMITGVNLPAAQLHVAMGIPLHRIPDVRRLYGLDAFGSTAIDFDTAKQVPPTGHVIAARITAENTDRGFTPTSGAVSELNFRNAPSVWGYFSVDSSGRVHEFADSQIGHLFGWGATRSAARRNVVLALKELSIRGDIRTNNEYLIELMESEDFKANRIDTTWLDSRIRANVPSARKPDALLVATIGAVVVGDTAIAARVDGFSSALTRGQLPTPDTLSVTGDVELIYESVKYLFTVSRSAPATVTVSCNGSSVTATVTVLADGGRLVRLFNRSHVVYTFDEPTGIRIVLDGVTCMFTDEYDPTQLRASMSGKLARFLVEEGATVASGQAFAEVEVMKMFMSLRVPEAGVIHLVKMEGSTLEPGELLATVALEDPSTVHRAELFTGQLSALSAASTIADDPTVSRRPNLLAQRATAVLNAVLDGYDVPTSAIDTALYDRDVAFADPTLPELEVDAVLASIGDKLPLSLKTAVDAAMDKERERLAGTSDDELGVPPAKGLTHLLPGEMNMLTVSAVLDAAEADLNARSLGQHVDLVAPLREVTTRFQNGIKGADRRNLVSYLQRFLKVESLFGGGAKERRQEDVIFDLKDTLGTDTVYGIARSHAHLDLRSTLVITLIGRLARDIEAAKSAAAAAAAEAAAALPDAPTLSLRSLSRSGFSSVSSVRSESTEQTEEDPSAALDTVPHVVHELAELAGVAYAEVTLEARQMLIVQQGPSLEQKMAAIEAVLSTVGGGTVLPGTEPGAEGGTTVPKGPLDELVDQEEPIADLMLPFFGRLEAPLPQNAALVYVRRMYRAYAIKSLVVEGKVALPEAGPAPPVPTPPYLCVRWEFSAEPRMSVPHASPAIPPADSVDDLQALTTRGSLMLSASLQRSMSRGSSSGWETPSSRGFAGLRDARFDNTMSEEMVHSAAVARHGVFCVFTDLRTLSAHFDDVVRSLWKASAEKPAEPPADGSLPDAATVPPAIHVVHVALLESPLLAVAPDSPASSVVGEVAHDADDNDAAEAAVVAMLTDFLRPYRPLLMAMGVRRVTFLTPRHDVMEVPVSAPPTPQLAALPPPAAAGAMKPGDAAAKPLASTPSSASTPSALGDVAPPPLTRTARSFRDRASTASTQDMPRTSMLRRSQDRHTPRIFTFRAKTGWSEDSIVRHIEPTHAGHLELRRLSKFNIRVVPVPNSSIHVYEAEPRPEFEDEDAVMRPSPESPLRRTDSEDKSGGAPSPRPSPPPVGAGRPAAATPPLGSAPPRRRAARRKRFFVRAIGRQTERIQTIGNVFDQFPGPERMFVEALNALNIAMGDALKDVSLPVGNNHIFLNVLPAVEVNPEYVESTIKILAKRYAERLRRLRVSQVEFRVVAVTGSQRVPVRLLSSNPTGYVLRVESYIETLDPATSTPMLASISASRLGLSFRQAAGKASRAGELDGKPVSTPYPVTTRFERSRALAATLSDTLYAYDFVELFERGVAHQWAQYSKTAHGPVRRPRSLVKVVELVLAPSDGGGTVPAAPAPLNRSESQFFSNEFGDRSFTRRHSASWGSPDQPAARSSTPAAASSADVRTWRLVESNRPPGSNTIGMIAWLMTLYTPEYPEAVGGRQVVLIANDITHQAGSFGGAEDHLFDLASKFARERGLPRVFLAANCGARIGLAEEVKSAFRVAWVDAADPTKGYKYLYLTPEDYADLASRKSVHAERVVEDGEERYRLTDIIGERGDLGVENLQGSGTIAAETARANASSFTLTYVTGRSVGIGAYLVRLGQRTIQKVTAAPILLTGYRALNKLVGRDVYSSNLQLGGPKIMHANGVTHKVVPNDFDGVTAILEWLSFVPRKSGEQGAVLSSRDRVDRDIACVPCKADDPRLFLSGKMVAQRRSAQTPSAQSMAGAGAPPEHPRPAQRTVSSFSASSVTITSEASAKSPAAKSPQEQWESGFFDRGSFVEYLDGWARTVIVGRARLGGIPIGVIAPETQPVTARSPADPASPESEERTTTQAGGVWYPDSAFKTAQAIRDFNGEGLPLIIFANWRGFSGGQRDMFDEVLKFGAYIVEALVNYTQPVFVYIPPGSELRGGAWVVVDPTINSDYMEMYADPTARGGVLEPSGTAEIKFRRPDLMKAAMRLDTTLQELSAKLDSPTASKEEKAATRKAIAERKAALMPVYLQVAHSFADLHDTPGRMVAKNCITRVVPWSESRSFFYFRLRRRMAELSLCRRVLAADTAATLQGAQALIRRWFDESLKSGDCVWSADRQVLEWMANNHSYLETNVSSLRRAAISDRVRAMGILEPTAVVQGVMALINCLPSHQREATVAALRRGILFNDPHAGFAGEDDGEWDTEFDADSFGRSDSARRSGSFASGGGGTWF